MARKRYIIATQNGYLDGDFKTKSNAARALAAEARGAAAECRKRYGTCSIVGSASKGSVEIRVGGRQGHNLWQRFVINKR